MTVVASDGDTVGTVKRALSPGFLHVDCRMAPDYYIPLKAVEQVHHGKVVLLVTKPQAAYMGWEVKPEAAE